MRSALVACDAVVDAVDAAGVVVVVGAVDEDWALVCPDAAYAVAVHQCLEPTKFYYPRSLENGCG